MGEPQGMRVTLSAKEPASGWKKSLAGSRRSEAYEKLVSEGSSEHRKYMSSCLESLTTC